VETRTRVLRIDQERRPLDLENRRPELAGEPFLDERQLPVDAMIALGQQVLMYVR
jgi:hypothetical protein